MNSMKASYKNYAIITTATKVSGREMWQLTLQIIDRNHVRVVGPTSFGELLTSVGAAHEAGVQIARHWIDGDSHSTAAAA